MPNYDHEYELTTEEQIERMLYHHDPEIRANAAWRLGRGRDMAALEALIQATQDNDAHVRVRAAESLANIRDERTIDPLIVLLKDVDADVRDGAAKALELQGDVKAVPALIDVLDDEAELVRAQAANALGVLNDDRAAEKLVDMFIHDEASTARFAASQSIASIGGEAVAHQLASFIPQIQDDTALLIEIIELLGKMRIASVVEAIQPLVNHSDEGVAATVEWALSILNR